MGDAAALAALKPPMAFARHTEAEEGEGAGAASPVHLAYLFAQPLVQKDLATGKRTAIDEVAGAEPNMLDAILDETKRTVGLWKANATDAHFQQALMRRPKVLHFSGHGTKRSLCLEDSTGCIQEMDNKMLQTRLSSESGANSVRLAVVSACHGEVAGDVFIAAGVPHVVTIVKQQEVSDKAAQEFFIRFYSNLFIGSTVDESFNSAVATIKSSSDKNVSKNYNRFKLMSGPNADRNERIYPQAGPGSIPAGKWSLLSLHPCTNRLSAKVSNFIGREKACQRLLSELMKNETAHINLYGVKGVGKTEVALNTARYLLQRPTIQVHLAGVFYCDMKKLFAGLPGVTSETPLIGATSFQFWDALLSSVNKCSELGCPDDFNALKTALHDKQLLFIIDHVEPWSATSTAQAGRGDSAASSMSPHGEDPASPAFVEFMRELTSCATRSRFIIVSPSQVNHELFVICPARVRVDPLEAKASATLFNSLVKGVRYVSKAELENQDHVLDEEELSTHSNGMYLPVSKKGNLIAQSVAMPQEHRLIELMAGLPSRILDAIPHLRNKTVGEIVRHFESITHVWTPRGFGVLPQGVKFPLDERWGLLLCRIWDGDNTTALPALSQPWPSFLQQLKDGWCELVGTDRPLTASGAAMLEADFRKHCSPPNHTHISLVQFQQFFEVYLVKVIHAIHSLGKLWTLTDKDTGNYYVHGFITTSQCQAYITNQKGGTIIIRLSSSQPGQLALSFANNDQECRHCILCVDAEKGFYIMRDLEQGEDGKVVDSNGKYKEEFENFAEFLLNRFHINGVESKAIYCETGKHMAILAKSEVGCVMEQIGLRKDGAGAGAGDESPSL